MKLITVCGPPASGKTAVVVHMAKALQNMGDSLGVAKFDCLATDDGRIYKKNGIPVQIGLSGGLCPDHFFGSNIEECIEWGNQNSFKWLITESAGLCNRCSPHIRSSYAICVIDNLMGAEAPRKIGPMLKMADVVAITKGDVVSQAEREVFAFHVRQANVKGLILPVSGITGQGCVELASIVSENAVDLPENLVLRFPMPAALCSYCLGETHLSSDLRFGNQRRMKLV